MKSPLLLCSAVSILALAACSTAPSERSITLRRGKIIVTENTPAPAAPLAPTAPTTPAPEAAPEASAPVVVSTPPMTVPEPVPVPAPVVVAPAPVAVAAPVVTPGLRAIRHGATVALDWTLPESSAGYRAVEIMRNTASTAVGRGRVRAVRATVTNLEDTLPDAGAEYWYWIKLTHADGTVQNIGPVATVSKS